MAGVVLPNRTYEGFVALPKGALPKGALPKGALPKGALGQFVGRDLVVLPTPARGAVASRLIAGFEVEAGALPA